MLILVVPMGMTSDSSKKTFDDRFVRSTSVIHDEKRTALIKMLTNNLKIGLLFIGYNVY
jgi:hypothetical protein